MINNSQSMTKGKIYIQFDIHYNWPPGKTSFAGFGTAKKNIEDGIKAVVGAKKKDKDKLYTFTELTEGPQEISAISKIISENSSKGRYLTGNFFTIIIYDKNNKPLKGTKINVKAKKPANATGPTSVNQQYFLEI